MKQTHEIESDTYQPCLHCGREPDAVSRLTVALKKAAGLMTPDEARFLVDTYYQIQETRKASSNQVKALLKIQVTTKEGEDTHEPSDVIKWVFSNTETLENQIKNALDRWSDDQDLGQWAKSITGIGPVIAAGLLAHIDIGKVETVGQIWRFAGLDPTVKWQAKTKRPWNAGLKTLCWKIGESFVKVSGNDKDYYGKVYLQRKALEMQKNDQGEYSKQATEKLAEKKIGKTTEAWAWYSGCYPADTMAKISGIADLDVRKKMLNEVRLEAGQGQPMLPPAHIHSRAKRYAVKLFLAHYFETAYRLVHHREPPMPYVISHLQHAHYIPAPGLTAKA
jgi:hypothetical protein